MPTARVGFFPLDQQLELVDHHWSEGVVRQAVWLSGLVSFEQAEMILHEIGQINISRNSIWRQSQAWGAKLRALEQGERVRANALPVKWEPPSRSIEPDRRLGVAMDGTMIHIRQEGWKELKVGTIFEVEVQPPGAEGSDDQSERAHAVNSSYATHLGGPEIFGELVWTEARRRRWEQTHDTMAMGDGATWIWNVVGLHFAGSQQLVDWYHAKQHLVAAAHCYKGENPSAFQRWLNSRETRLYQGHAERIANELDQAASEKPEVAEQLRREAGYFRQNQHRMNYLEMRENDWPIGSGMVESAGKQFKARFCGPGMRWSRSGAENLLPIRAAVLSKRFDEVWNKARNSPPT